MGYSCNSIEVKGTCGGYLNSVDIKGYVWGYSCISIGVE